MRILNTFSPKSNTNKPFFASLLTKQCVNAWKPPVAGETPVIVPEQARAYREAADALIAGALEAHFVNPHREVKENPWLTSGAASAKPHGLSEAEKQELYPLIPYTMLTSACYRG